MPHLTRGFLHALGTADIYQALGICGGTLMVLVISLHRLQVVVDGGGLRIHWLDVTHLLILGFCLFFWFLFFGFFVLSFFGSQHFPPSCTRKDVVLPIRHRLRRLQSAPSSAGAPNQTEDQDWDTGCSQIIEIETQIISCHTSDPLVFSREVPWSLGELHRVWFTKHIRMRLSFVEVIENKTAEVTSERICRVRLAAPSRWATGHSLVDERDVQGVPPIRRGT